MWLPMLAGDSRSAWDGNVLNDPRVVEFWDGDRIAGKWFADRGIGGAGEPGGIAWDAYYAFGGSSKWDAEPTELRASGSTIIDHVGGLEDDFVPLLTGSR